MSLLRMLFASSIGEGTYAQGAKIDSPAPATGSLFGGWVALSGDGSTLAVVSAATAAPVSVFVRSGPAWTLQQTISIPAPHAAAFASRARLSDSGDTLIFSGRKPDDGSGGFGGVWIYTRSAGTWSLQQAIVRATTGSSYPNDLSLSPNGMTIAVGDAGYSSGVSAQGAVEVYTVSGGVWTLQQTLTASGASSFDGLGCSVAVSGDTLAAGAYGDDAGAVNSGAVCIFTRSGTTWTEQVRLKAATPVAGAGLGGEYGGGVALSADEGTVVAFAASSPAACWTWVGGGASWTPLSPTTGALDMGFGLEVSQDGATLIAPRRSGGAWVFANTGATWAPVQLLQASPPQAPPDGYGYSAAISRDGRFAVVGYPQWDTSPYTDNGSVFYFYR